MAIKKVRQYKGVGLKEAKDYVEQNPNRFLLAEDLDSEQLKDVLAETARYGMETEVK